MEQVIRDKKLIINNLQETTEQFMKGFIAILRRYRLAMLMNFAGLVLAFTAFMAIMLQMDYQRGFDRHYPTAGRIFRVDKEGMDKDETFCNILPRGYVDDIISSSPHITAGSISCPFVGEVIYYARHDEGSEPFAIKYRTEVVYPELFEVFGTRFVEGSADAIEDLSAVAIPRSLAETLYGKESALGHTITHTQQFFLGSFRGKDLTIGAVYEDFPANSQMDNAIYMNIGSVNQGSYGGANYICWLLLDSPDSKELVEQNFNENFKYENSSWLPGIELTPIEDIYFNEDEISVYKSGSRKQMWLMLCISLLVMLVGGINYATFFTALAPMRVKPINTQKVLGSSLTRLRTGLFTESVLFSLLAFAIALCITGPVTGWLVSESLLQMSFSPASHWNIALLSLLIAFVTGLAAGAYPSLYVTSLPPAFALKGNFAFSASGRRFRTAMMIFQYAVSFALIVAVVTISRQNDYMMSYDTGNDGDRIEVTVISQTHAQEKRDWLQERLCALPEVEDVAFAMEIVGNSDIYSTSTLTFNGNDVLTFMIYCSYNFLDVMGIDITEGRGFMKSDENAGKVIVNQAAIDAGAYIGIIPDLGEIIGQTGHTRINSLRDDAMPTCYVLLPPQCMPMQNVYIRLAEGCDRPDVRKKISEVLKEMDPAYPFEIRAYDTVAGELYRQEGLLGKTISLFSLLAVLLSLVGIFGQVMLDVQYRRREIAVRKVYGADTAELLKDGLTKYCLLVLSAFVIAAPLAWLAVSRWLEGFSEHVGIAIWPFVAALLAVLLLTLGIVSCQLRQAASADPADALKSE